MVGEFLVAVVTVLSDNGDCFEMTQAEFGDAE
jgi:hypothetical protein